MNNTLNIIANAIAGVCDFLKIRFEKQFEGEILREKRKLKTATNIAEIMFRISLKYINCFSEKDKKRFNRMYKKFERYN